MFKAQGFDGLDLEFTFSIDLLSKLVICYSYF